MSTYACKLFVYYIKQIVYTVIPKGVIYMRTFSERFKTLRQEKGLTQEQLADALHITKQAVSHYERGTREPKNQEMYEAIADFFNVDMNYLIGKNNRTSQILNDDEYRLLSAYRQASDEIKKAAQAVLHI